ncbi:hypothetical protein [Sanguibacter sp. HDW7]|uniref:hypothetical protein n=1 Tax=Sanguibacter sp. HDW7 TaxID=2714931 RepID=UPI001407E0BA|nr:hypothetical protein [Sanguibacter sp. HDW7]QIK82550.1 hypothetical protein G7063_02125 [Sanguibacter sp. HDW7]
MTTPEGPPDDAAPRGRHAADPSHPSPLSPPSGTPRSPYDPPVSPDDAVPVILPDAPVSWSPQPGPGVPQLSDEAYARAFAEIERAAASWDPPAQRHPYPAPRLVYSAASDPNRRTRSVPRRRGGWLSLVLVLVVTVVGLDRFLGPDRLSPTLDVPRVQWLGEPPGLGGDWPRPGVDAEKDRILPAVTPSRIGPHEMLSDVATWSPCRTIRVVIDPTGAPKGFEGWLGQVLAEASALSGLSIAIEGTTDERVSFDREPYQPSRYGDRWAPAIVGWATPEQIPELAGNVAGLGGAQYVSRGNQTGYVTGGIALDLELLDAARQAGEPAYVGVLRHEVGHLLGLGHVDAPETLMYGGANSVSAWGPGEIEGLAALGAGRCTPHL